MRFCFDSCRLKALVWIKPVYSTVLTDRDTQSTFRGRRRGQKQTLTEQFSSQLLIGPAAVKVNSPAHKAGSRPLPGSRSSQEFGQEVEIFLSSLLSCRRFRLSLMTSLCPPQSRSRSKSSTSSLVSSVPFLLPAAHTSRVSDALIRHTTPPVEKRDASLAATLRRRV